MSRSKAALAPSGEMNWVAHASGLRVGFLVTLFVGFYPRNESTVTVRSKHPRVKPTRWAPAFLNGPTYRSNGILSLTGAVNRKEQDRDRINRPPEMTNRDMDTLKANHNRFIRIRTIDGEVMIARMRFVSDSNQDLIYDLVSTSKESQYEKHDEQPAYRIGFDDIESVEAVPSS